MDTKRRSNLIIIIIGVVIFIVFLILFVGFILSDFNLSPSKNTDRVEEYVGPNNEKVYYNPNEATEEELKQVIKEAEEE